MCNPFFKTRLLRTNYPLLHEARQNIVVCQLRADLQGTDKSRNYPITGSNNSITKFVFVCKSLW